VTSDLLYTEIEEDLRSSVRALLADRSPWQKVLAGVDAGAPEDPALWRALGAELGCAGLLVPEEHGGAGASAREAAVVLEELGRAVAPTPFLTSAVVATSVLLACGHTEPLAALAAGEVTAALAVPLSTAPSDPVPPAVSVAGDRLSGTVTSVAGALAADLLLVPAGEVLYLVEAGAFTRTPVVALDQTRPLADLTLDGVPGRQVAAGMDATAAVAAGLLAGAALLASEQLGVADWCLETTVAYTKTRTQFARPVGSFQALKHRLADLWVEISQSRSVARYAAGCLATDDPDLPIAAALAQAHCAPTALHAAEECVQLHGGIGFTWEHPAHLYLKRAAAAHLTFGAPTQHRSTLATLLDLPPA
jgi:alkylation response protein AidB-like acyl-CoA dehydrogenase